MNKKATQEDLDALHSLLAKHYTKLLEEGNLTSGELNAINTFLKNNDITVSVVESNPVQSLISKMKDIDIEQLTNAS